MGRLLAEAINRPLGKAHLLPERIPSGKRRPARGLPDPEDGQEAGPNHHRVADLGGRLFRGGQVHTGTGSGC